jgi:hypothetical protein
VASTLSSSCRYVKEKFNVFNFNVLFIEVVPKALLHEMIFSSSFAFLSIIDGGKM